MSAAFSCESAEGAKKAVAVFAEGSSAGSGVVGEIICENISVGLGQSAVKLVATFTKLPSGLHGFHIHRSGDLRGKGCMGACEHFHMGPPAPHGGPPGDGRPRHTGDLGNIRLGPGGTPFRAQYFLEGISCQDLWGRTAIIHADEDDLGRGQFADSVTTGHAGARIACAIFGRAD